MTAAASLAFAQSTQPIANPIHRSSATSTKEPAGLSSQQQVLDTGRVLLALGAVLALIFLLRFSIKKMAPAMVGRGSRGVRVVSRTAIGPKQQVLIVQVGRRVLIVGESGQQLRTLSEITDPDEIAALLGQMQGGVGARCGEGIVCQRDGSGGWSFHICFRHDRAD